MILLSVEAITKHYGPEPVLSGVTFDVRPGDRIGLVGPNGAGKTTLLRIITEEEQADSGTIEQHRSVTVGYLEQQPEFKPEETVWQIARQAMGDLIRLAEHAEEVALAMAEEDDEEERKRLGERFDHLQQQLHHSDGYNLDYKIQSILQGLGFQEEAFEQPAVQLSGGQQNRLLLAKLLLAEPDLMLLDEPSNHLDIDATQWLENYLTENSQALIVVSHDRYFLDKVTNRTLELFRGTVDSYTGNFSAYWRQKTERLEVQRRTYEKQEIEIARLEDFVRRNKYGQKHAQAEDREKKLERIERIEMPREIVAASMGFPKATRSGDIALRVEHLSKSYDMPLFSDLTFDILRGEKWGIIGPNGSGKTTLLRTILGRVIQDSGEVIWGTGVVPAYFDQLLSGLNADTEVVEAIRPPHKEFVEKERRSLLARFGLTDDIVFQKIESLSGGERNRAALARLAALDSNFLVLDEPTNHLDLWACDSLEKSINNFEGTVLLVSHDRFFLNRVVDHLLIVEKDRFRVIQGNYDMYLHLVKQGLAGDVAVENESGKDKNGKKERNDGRQKTPKRRRRFPYRKLNELEDDINQCEQQIGYLHQQLTLPEVLRDGERVKSINSELQQQQAVLAGLYEHWEEAVELN